MPNELNVNRPVSLVGTGRSGTTLLTNVFRRNSKFDSYGETSNLIFPAFYFAEQTLPHCAPTITRESAPGLAGVALRSMMIGAFPGDKEHWFHKPILLASVKNRFECIDAFISWYWKSYKIIFPDATTITVLRDPTSVIPSYMRRWGQSQEVATRNYCETMQLLIGGSDSINLAIHFDQLVNDSENTIRQMFSIIGCDYEDSSMEAFNKAHAPNSNNGKLDDINDIRSRMFTAKTCKNIRVDKLAISLYEQAVDELDYTKLSVKAKAS